MKLSDFNTKELKQMKQACIDTRAKYDGYRDHQIPKFKKGDTCALCELYYHSICGSCPHVVIGNVTIGNPLILPCVKAMFFREKAMTRRNRLDRWIKLIDEEILKHSMRSSEAQIGIKPNFE